MEVALAATVLALTLTGMIGVIEAGTQMLDLSRKQTLAAQILHGEIERLHLVNWNTIAGCATQYGVPNTPIGNGYPSGPTTLKATPTTDPNYDVAFGEWATNYAAVANVSVSQVAAVFTLTRSVACIEPSQPNSNPTAYTNPPLLLQVTYTITWTGVTGRTYTRTSTTYVGYNGLSQAYQRS